MGVHPSWKVSEVSEKVWENQIVCVCVCVRVRVRVCVHASAFSP